MASITIKNIPEDLHLRLKQRAEEHRRSLNAEVIACLEAIMAERTDDPEAWIREARVLREEVGGYLTPDSIDALIEEGRRH